MKIIITDTNKIEDLTIIDQNNGIEYTRDLIADDRNISVNDDGEYTTDSETYEWWSNYLDELKSQENPAA